jgi:aryl-alcohol dehydrogenase-like predicted oxidoreductase
VLPTCQRYGMGVIPYSPLAGGWLSGRYRTDADAGNSLIEIAVAFVLRHPAVTAAIIGPRTKAHLGSQLAGRRR